MNKSEVKSLRVVCQKRLYQKQSKNNIFKHYKTSPKREFEGWRLTKCSPFFHFSYVWSREQRRSEFQWVCRRLEVHYRLAEHLPHLRQGQLRVYRQERAQTGSHWLWWVRNAYLLTAINGKPEVIDVFGEVFRRKSWRNERQRHWCTKAIRGQINRWSRWWKIINVPIEENAELWTLLSLCRLSSFRSVLQHADREIRPSEERPSGFWWLHSVLYCTTGNDLCCATFAISLKK